MLSMQHALCAIIQLHTSTEKQYIQADYTKYLVASIYPDAIRAYTKHRELSHFEENSIGDEVTNKEKEYIFINERIDDLLLETEVVEEIEY